MGDSWQIPEEHDRTPPASGWGSEAPVFPASSTAPDEANMSRWQKLSRTEMIQGGQVVPVAPETRSDQIGGLMHGKCCTDSKRTHGMPILE
jgi:hypothetical protein